MSQQPARRYCHHDCAVLASLVFMTCLFCLPFRADGSERRRTPIVEAVEGARPSVVNIHGEKTIDASGANVADGEDGRRVNGMGTGVVIDSRGYIITNHHVVDGVQRIRVALADGRELTARLIAHDLGTDLAVIKIDAGKDLPTITIGTSSDLMPGETVLAVGNAYGYGHTATLGIISALKRAVQVSDAQYYQDLIQTDASINPGNSGGPLLNIDGEMIGINVAVRAGAQGIGFAIPVDKALKVATKLLASYSTKTAWHGIRVSDGAVMLETPSDNEPESDAAPPEVTNANVEVAGVIVEIDTGSPAAEGGLEAGDVITTVDHRSVRRGLDFACAMLERQVGDKIEVVVQRNGQQKHLQLTLAEHPKPLEIWTLLGLQLEAITPEQFKKKHKTCYSGGLAVTAVRPNGPASTMGMRQGDVLVGMHVWETVCMADVAYVMAKPDFRSKESPIKFTILRGDRAFFGHLQIASRIMRRR